MSQTRHKQEWQIKPKHTELVNVHVSKLQLET